MGSIYVHVERRKERTTRAKRDRDGQDNKEVYRWRLESEYIKEQAQVRRF